MGLMSFSRSDPFEVAFFRIVKWILGFLGLWPLDPLTRSTKIKIFVNLGILLIAIVGEIRLTWFIRSKPIEAFDAVCPCITKMVTWMKLVCFVAYRKELALLLRGLFEHLAADTKDTRKNAMILKISFFTVLWSMWLYFFGISTNCFYNTKPIIIWAYQRYSGENDTWVGLPFRAALPYEDMTRVGNKVLYAFVYCFLGYSGNVTIFGFPGVDGAFMCICMYISACFQCLQEDFKEAFKRHTSRGFECTTNDVLYRELAVLVKRQQDVTVMFNLFERVYKYMVFGHFLFAGIALGVALVDLLLTPGIAKTIYVTFSMGACSQVYTYCYGAASVDENCSKLSETLYFCDWYKCDNRVRKLVLFVMARSQRGSLLSAPFFTPSLPLFATIIKTSGSYITLLKAFL